MRWVRTLAGVLALGVALAACAPPVTSGTVISKTFSPAHDEQYMQSHTMLIGKTDMTYYTPETRHIDADWQIEVRQESHDQNGKLIKATGWIDVSENTYDHTKFGQFYATPKT